jgi:hypothetical protein
MAINPNARRSHIVRAWLEGPRLAALRQRRKEANEANREKMREKARRKAVATEQQ